MTKEELGKIRRKEVDVKLEQIIGLFRQLAPAEQIRVLMAGRSICKSRFLRRMGYDCEGVAGNITAC